jgi:hypothetical protein
MSELIITCCDYCNKDQSVQTYNGRGYIYVPEEDAIRLFDWIRDETGKIMCLNCQDEREEKDVVK